MGEEVAVAARCSSLSDWSSSPQPAPPSFRVEERWAGSLQKPGGWVWPEAGHLHSSCSVIGQCGCQWGPAGCSYCDFSEKYH